MSTVAAGGHHYRSRHPLTVAELLRRDGDGPPSPPRRQPGRSASALPVALTGEPAPCHDRTT